MRLIDADRFYDEIKRLKGITKIGYTKDEERIIESDLDLFMLAITEQPTAYDVDEVMNRLSLIYIHEKNLTRRVCGEINNAVLQGGICD